MTSNAMLPRGLGELTRALTDADRIALAFTALSILRLPAMLHQYWNARDMLDILAGKPCVGAGYILGQAHRVLSAYSGWQLHGRHIDWQAHEETRAEVERLVAEALEKRRELLEEKAFR
jgi:hypothetical protein